jgi:hypothetical protein
VAWTLLSEALKGFNNLEREFGLGRILEDGGGRK